jgi:hypothetical protein
MHNANSSASAQLQTASRTAQETSMQRSQEENDQSAHLFA